MNSGFSGSPKRSPVAAVCRLSLRGSPSRDDGLGVPAGFVLTAGQCSRPALWVTVPMGNALLNWLDHRTGYRSVIRAALDRPVPGGVGWRHVIPRCIAFGVFVDVLTGVLLMAVYTPSVSGAWGSVHYIEHQVTAGWWIRGLHHYTSWLLVGLLPLYLLYMVFTRLYAAPRELLFWCGLLFIPLVLALGLTGNALPWDQSGYWAIHVETTLASTVPVVGETLRSVVLGGAALGQATITRLYTLHVVVLPVGVALLFLLYRFMTRGGTDGGEAYWPRQTTRNITAYAVFLAAAAGMTLVWRTPLDSPADPFSAFPARPEWYMMFLYRLRHYFDGRNELYAIAVIPAAAALLLLAYPVIGWIRFRRTAHALLVLLTVGGVGSVAALTGLAVQVDREDAAFQAQSEEEVTLAARAVELASAGIPPDGAIAMLHRDPVTRGPILFRNHCARCHRHEAIVHAPTTSPMAANLTGYGTVAWIERLMTDPGHEDFFGQVEGFTRMARWVERNMEDLGPENLRAVALYLASAAPSAELMRDMAEHEPKPGDPDIETLRAGREVFLEYCFECHTLAAEESHREKRRKFKAPDLTGYASYDWTRRMMREPEHVDLYGRRNQMPSVKTQLTDTQVDVLARWLVNDE